MKSLREKRKAELKDRIFEISMRLFIEQGYENTTVSQIAEACSIAKGTFFNYFPKKEAVLTYFGEIQYDRVRFLVAELIEQNLPADIILKRLFETWLDKTQENPNLTRTLILETLKKSTAMEDFNNQVMHAELLSKVVQFGQSQDIFKKDYDPLEMGENLLALYLYTCMQWASRHTEDIYSKWNRTLDSYLDGLRAEKK